MNTIDISVVVPTYNVGHKLENCLKSLDELHQILPRTEAIFVDDHSTDGTFDLIEAFASGRSWITTHRLPSNTGSPSRPRDIGTELAKGQYVYFLDGDDELLPHGVKKALEIAQASGADVVRAPLVRDDGRHQKVLNVVSGWLPDWDRLERIEAVIRNQSTTVCGLISKDLLSRGVIQWPEGLRMGEDTVFLVDVLLTAERIEYSQEPDFIYHAEHIPGARSSTQQYEDRELRDHLRVWNRVVDRLATVGIDYMRIRGSVGIGSSFWSLIKHNRGSISEELFRELHQLFSAHAAVIRSLPTQRRHVPIREAVLAGDYGAFTAAIKPRLLVAGHDLKFIEPAYEKLREHFDVRVDEWKGHDAHDPVASQRLLEWADVIHAEWLLGNATWYSRHKRPHQRLVTRCHRFEIQRDFGTMVDRTAVDRYIAVSLPTMEDMQARFAFPRERVRLLPNFIDVDRYQHSDSPDRVFNIAIVGAVPSLKGLRKALQLVQELRLRDSRYNLTIYGKAPHELSWVANDVDEAAYYAACDAYIDSNGLRDAVHWRGWCDMRESLAENGFVLSVSDFESFHVAPAEAFAAGNMALFLPWPGVEYIYPSRYVMPSVEAMRDKILGLQNAAAFDEEAREGADFVRENYSLDAFVAEYVKLVQEIG